MSVLFKYCDLNTHTARAGIKAKPKPSASEKFLSDLRNETEEAEKKGALEGTKKKRCVTIQDRPAC